MQRKHREHLCCTSIFELHVVYPVPYYTTIFTYCIFYVLLQHTSLTKAKVTHNTNPTYIAIGWMIHKL